MNKNPDLILQRLEKEVEELKAQIEAIEKALAKLNRTSEQAVQALLIRLTK